MTDDRLDGVAILGYGRFGQALATLLADAGARFRCLDARVPVPVEIVAPDLATLVASARFIVLAVPLHALAHAGESLLPHLDPERHVVVDVTPSKRKSVRLLHATFGSRIPWVSTHPLFGAASIASAERPLPLVVCKNDLHVSATTEVAATFRKLGCDIHVMTAEEHDATIARTHALPFFVLKALANAGVASSEHDGVTAPALRGLVRTMKLVRGLEDDVLREIAPDVPESAEARRALIADLLDIDRALGAVVATEVPRSARLPPAPVNVDLGGRSPELRRTRDAIDELDREIVALLAQRGRLAIRAREAKEELGHGVVDASREAALLRTRRAWAIEQQLDPDAVEDVFDAIMAFSRAVQRTS